MKFVKLATLTNIRKTTFHKRGKKNTLGGKVGFEVKFS